MVHLRRRKRRHVPRVSEPGARKPLSTPNPLFSPESLSVIGYGPGGYEEIACSSIGDISRFREKWPVVWVDVDGLGNPDLIVLLGKEFNLPALLLEDVFNVSHQPKIEEFDKFIFMILKNGLFTELFETEQISLVLMERMVITIQERPGDSFAQVRTRIRDGIGKIRQFGPDFLMYALMNAVVEGYYPILEIMKKQLDALEDTFIEDSGTDVIHKIHDIKSNLLFMHSAVWPIRDITLVVAHEDVPVVTAGTKHYLRDCQDQAKQVTELTEFYRLIASDLMSTYLAYSDNKANEVMKLLTMVASVFIPLTFITGLYGMNFDRASPYNMPELGYRYGYPIVLTVMALITIGILLGFRRAGWIGKILKKRNSRNNFHSQ